MEQLSNIDVIILIVIALSALLAFYRGLIKEVLSIIGWVILTVLMIYLLPIATPLFNKHIESGFMSGVAASVAIFVTFFILWFVITALLTGKIRSHKKLNMIDRFLGLFFGILRACLLIVLIYIAIGWVIPLEEQPEFLTKSRYYNVAGTFAEPLENLLPEQTINLIKEKGKEVRGVKEDKEDDKTDDSLDDLFDKLTQPKIKSSADNKDEKSASTEAKNTKPSVVMKKQDKSGYQAIDRNNLNNLIENLSN